MKIYEILYFSRELLARLSAAGIKMDDYRYINLYNDYTEIVSGGDKVSYAVIILSQKYAISVRQIYKIIKRLSTTVQPEQQ